MKQFDLQGNEYDCQIEYPKNWREEAIKNRKEIERLNNIINEIEKELDLNLPFKVIGVRGLKNKIKELKEK